MFTKSLCTLQK